MNSLLEIINSRNFDIASASEEYVLITEDCFDVLENMVEGAVDLIFADPPYFLSGDGITNSGGNMVSVSKGDWDKKISINDKNKFNRKWLEESYRILKKDGTIWISGTFHNIFSVGVILEEVGFEVLNIVTWVKTNPSPNLSCKTFTHSSEFIIWAKKKGAKNYNFNYELMKKRNGDKQMKDVWFGGLTPPKEKKLGKHPTQKPLYILERIIEASTQLGDIVLDPFSGSGTTGVAAFKLGRKYIGIEMDPIYNSIATRRLESSTNYLF